MIKARGLHHINLNVRDIGRSLKFYQEAFGLEVDFWEGKKMVFLHSPGAHDTITLCQAKEGRAYRRRRSVAFWILAHQE